MFPKEQTAQKVVLVRGYIDEFDLAWLKKNHYTISWFVKTAVHDRVHKLQMQEFAV
jgi:predicted NUDIX family NTP pyrophosphohydrolase